MQKFSKNYYTDKKPVFHWGVHVRCWLVARPSGETDYKFLNRLNKVAK